MKSYYEILEVQPKAEILEIKKAYFKAVRKYPPDRYPNQFMQIRKAYETLSNVDMREEYDTVFNMHAMDKQVFELARQAMEDGNPERAILLLERILRYKSNLLVAKSLLGEAYMQNGNTGKAVTLFEELVSRQPNNAAFAGHYAKACLGRGWHKKAIDAYKRALELDEDNLSLWMELSCAYINGQETKLARDVLLKALEIGIDKEWDNISLYMHLIQVDIMSFNIEDMEQDLEELTMLAQEQVDITEHVGWALVELTQYLLSAELITQANKVIERAVRLLPNDENAQQLKEKLNRFSRLKVMLEELELDDAIQRLIYDLIDLEVVTNDILDTGDLEKEAMAFMLEEMVVEEYFKYQKSIERVKENYPELYEVKASFFEAILNTKKRKKLLAYYRKNNIKYRSVVESMFSSDMELYEDEEEYLNMDNIFAPPQQPYVREQPKIGRNEPCPCGSGKKHKKCCG